MKITQALLDSLTEQAKASPRLRMNQDLRNSADDQSQRQFIGIESLPRRWYAFAGVWWRSFMMISSESAPRPSNYARMARSWR